MTTSSPYERPRAPLETDRPGPKAPLHMGHRVALSVAPAAAAGVVFTTIVALVMTGSSLLADGSEGLAEIGLIAASILPIGLFLVAPAWLFLVVPLLVYSKTPPRRLWGRDGLLWSVVLWIAYSVVVLMMIGAANPSSFVETAGLGAVSGLPAAACCVLGTGLMVRWYERLGDARAATLAIASVLFGAATVVGSLALSALAYQRLTAVPF